MKVVSKNKDWKKRIKCKECRAELEIEEKDVYVVNTAVGYAGESFDPQLRVNCGRCKSSVDVSDKVPSGIENSKIQLFREKYKV